MNSQISHMIFYTEYDTLIIYQKKGGNGMQKAIFSRVDLTSDNDLLAKEFVSCIQDLIAVSYKHLDVYKRQILYHKTAKSKRKTPWTSGIFQSFYIFIYIWNQYMYA